MVGRYELSAAQWAADRGFAVRDAWTSRNFPRQAARLGAARPGPGTSRRGPYKVEKLFSRNLGPYRRGCIRSPSGPILIWNEDPPLALTGMMGAYLPLQSPAAALKLRKR